MDERHKQDLMVAIAFAKEFVKSVEVEMFGDCTCGGATKRREEAQMQLMAALNGIDYKEEA